MPLDLPFDPQFTRAGLQLAAELACLPRHTGKMADHFRTTTAHVALEMAFRRWLERHATPYALHAGHPHGLPPWWLACQHRRLVLRVATPRRTLLALDAASLAYDAFSAHDIVIVATLPGFRQVAAPAVYVAPLYGALRTAISPLRLDQPGPGPITVNLHGLDDARRPASYPVVVHPQQPTALALPLYSLSLLTSAVAPGAPLDIFLASGEHHRLGPAHWQRMSWLADVVRVHGWTSLGKAWQARERTGRGEARLLLNPDDLQPLAALPALQTPHEPL